MAVSVTRMSRLTQAPSEEKTSMFEPASKKLKVCLHLPLFPLSNKL